MQGKAKSYRNRTDGESGHETRDLDAVTLLQWQTRFALHECSRVYTPNIAQSDTESDDTVVQSPFGDMSAICESTEHENLPLDPWQRRHNFKRLEIYPQPDLPHCTSAVSFLTTAEYEALHCEAEERHRLRWNEASDSKRRSMALKFHEWADAGRVDLTSAEAKALCQYVTGTVDQILAVIAMADARFSAKRLNIGSVAEKVKTGCLDEMDFLCEVEQMPGLRAARHRMRTYKRSQQQCKSYFALFFVKESPWIEYTINAKGLLNSRAVKRDFLSALRQAVQMMHGGVERDLVAIEENGPAFTVYIKSPYYLLKRNKRCQAAPNSRTGLNHSTCAVKVDLTLAIPVPKCRIVQAILTPAVRNGPCNKCHFIPTEEFVWRLSFAEFETLSVRSLSTEARDCLLSLKVS